MDSLPDITLLKVSLELGLQVRKHAHVVCQNRYRCIFTGTGLRRLSGQVVNVYVYVHQAVLILRFNRIIIVWRQMITKTKPISITSLCYVCVIMIFYFYQVPIRPLFTIETAMKLEILDI